MTRYYDPVVEFMRSLQTMADEEDWREDAACKGEDPNLWFAEGRTPEATDRREQAKKICQRCPVQQPCLDSAIENKESFGIWGGMGISEVTKIRRARQKRGSSS